MVREARWGTFLFLALGRLRQEDFEFKISQILKVNPFLKKRRGQRRKE